MNLNKMTVKAKEALEKSGELANSKNHQTVDIEHLLMALLEQDGLVKPILQNIEVNISKLESILEERLERKPKIYGAGQTYISKELNEALDYASKEAGRLRDEFVSTEHLLLGILNIKEASLQDIFHQIGLNYDSLLLAIKNLRGTHRVTDENPEAKYNALDKIQQGFD